LKNKVTVLKDAKEIKRRRRRKRSGGVWKEGKMSKKSRTSYLLQSVDHSTLPEKNSKEKPSLSILAFHQREKEWTLLFHDILRSRVFAYGSLGDVGFPHGNSDDTKLKELEGFSLGNAFVKKNRR
jgi:hypothetical protein